MTTLGTVYSHVVLRLLFCRTFEPEVIVCIHVRRTRTNFLDSSLLLIYLSDSTLIVTYSTQFTKVSGTMSVISEDRVRGVMFKDIHADEEDAQPTEIESLCMNCYENVSD